MRTAYMDETTREGYIGVASVHANDQHWTQFSERWNRALETHHASYLHMREFAHSREMFEGWSEEQRRGLLGDCLACLDGLPISLTASVMLEADFRRLDEARQKHLNDPYLIVFQDCVQASVVANYTQPSGEKLATVFSRNDEFKGRFDTIFNRAKREFRDGSELGELKFEDMRSCPPLQLADLVGYEVVQYASGKHNRYPFKKLREHQTEHFKVAAFRCVPFWKLDAATRQDPNFWRNVQETMLADPERYREQYCEQWLPPLSRELFDLSLRAYNEGFIDRVRARDFEVPSSLRSAPEK